MRKHKAVTGDKELDDDEDEHGGRGKKTKILRHRAGKAGVAVSKTRIAAIDHPGSHCRAS